MVAYDRPGELHEALALLARGPMTIAAGCTDLFPATGARALEGPVLDITGIAALRGISLTDPGLRIGGCTTWTDILRADLPPALDMLKQAAAEVGSVQIQNAGTVAGNLCNASPAADGVPCLLALDAEVELASTAGTRTMSLAEFLTGPRRTARAPSELLTAVTIPAEALAGASRFLKLGARRYLVISIAMVAVRLACEAGCVGDAAVAVGACSGVAQRLPRLEAALIGQPVEGLAGLVRNQLIAPALKPISDVRADAAYRERAAVELVRRALSDLAEAEVPA
ncbi:FAD binding domain-containing protein [Halovulum sp. GXIMD14794]